MAAKILKYTISPDGIPLATFELEYPRFILAELNTHGMLSKNTASSRAITIEAMVKLVEDSPVIPIYWGKKNKGMSAIEEIGDAEKEEAKKLWLSLRNEAIKTAKEFDRLQLHKQIANRILEPWVPVKTVVSGTELANFFWLRYHRAAQPEFAFLAGEMYNALKNCSPTLLRYGEWHLPYVESVRNEKGTLIYFNEEGDEISIEEARKLSASCCAQVSYRKLNQSGEKAEDIFNKLINTDNQPVHASPVCHQATPINLTKGDFENGITHMDKDGMLWSANFRGWIQFRKLIKNESVPGFYIDISA